MKKNVFLCDFFLNSNYLARTHTDCICLSRVEFLTISFQRLFPIVFFFVFMVQAELMGLTGGLWCDSCFPCLPKVRK